MNVKPRLRLKGGIWSCVSWAEASGWPVVEALGFGYTALEAFEDWKAQASPT